MHSFVFYELADGSRCYVGDTPERHTNTEVGAMQAGTYRVLDGELYQIISERNKELPSG